MKPRPARLEELLESARAAGSRDPQALLEDLRCVLGAEDLSRRVALAARRERGPSAWRRAAAVLAFAAGAALCARLAWHAGRPGRAQTDPFSARALELRRERAELERALPALARAGDAAADPGAQRNGLPGDLLGDLLVARSAGVAAHAFPAWLNDAARLDEAGALERVLWAELLCDRYVLLGQHPLLLAALLDGPVEPSVGALRAHVLARAERLGLQPGETGADLGGMPLSESWLKQLAGQAAVQRDARAQRWVASALQR